MRPLICALAITLLGVHLLAPPTEARSSTKSFTATLEGTDDYPPAHGEASASWKKGGKKKFVVSISDVPKEGGLKLSVYVDDVRIGLIKLDRSGKGTLTINRLDDSLPTVTKRSRVDVRTEDGDDKIAEGTFKQQ